MENSRRNIVKTALTQIYGENLNKTFVLKGSQVLIGRNLKADIRLECPNVSRKHCILTFTNNGWIIKDNSSQNGTYINGRHLKAGESSAVQGGDIIFLGPPSEMPQAFCVEIEYQSLEEKAMDFESPPIQNAENEDMGISTDLPKSIKEIPSSKCPKKQNAENVEDMGISTDLPKSKKEIPSSKCPKKGRILRSSRSTGKDVVMEIEEELKKKTETDSSITAPANVKRKRKVPSASKHLQEFSSLKIPPKKSKITVDFEPDKAMDNNQVNEISSTEDDQVEDSLSLLDIKEKAESHEFFSADDINKPSCSHNVPPPEDKAENERLKSELASVAKQLKKFQREKEEILEYMSKKNQTLAEQLAEKEKLKEELQNCELRAKNEIKKELLEKFGEDLVCIICSELLIKPSVLDCAHTFCEHCIKMWKKTKNECPMCRKRIETVTRVLTLDNFIEKTVQTLTPEQREVRETLIKDRQEKEKQKATSKKKKSSRRRNQNVRTVDNVNRPPRDSVEIIGESNMIFPFTFPTITSAMPFLYDRNFRVPESIRRSMEALNFYIT